jgi:hypothetical protein
MCLLSPMLVSQLRRPTSCRQPLVSDLHVATRGCFFPLLSSLFSPLPLVVVYLFNAIISPILHTISFHPFTVNLSSIKPRITLFTDSNSSPCRLPDGKLPPRSSNLSLNQRRTRRLVALYPPPKPGRLPFP